MSITDFIVDVCQRFAASGPVNAKNLTLEELSASRLPDKHLGSITAYFQSNGGEKYEARFEHTYRDSGKGIEVEIYAPHQHRSESDLENVEQIILESGRRVADVADLNANERENPVEREKLEPHLISTVYLTGDLTQQGVAGLLREWQQQFSITNIEAEFYYVSRLHRKNPGFPTEKVSVGFS